MNSVALAIGFLLLKNWLPKYFEEKAKNLAQKEDLAQLTAISEEVRSKFEAGSLVFRAQFEVEFERMQGVWARAKRLQRAFVEAFPHPDFSTPTKEKFTEFVEHQIDFLDFMEGSLPFLPIPVSQSFRAFDELMTDMKTRGLMPLAPHEAKRYRDEVRAALKQAEETIRGRIEELRIIQ